MLSLLFILYLHTPKILPDGVITSAFYTHMCSKELRGNMVSVCPDSYHLCFALFIQDQIFFNTSHRTGNLVTTSLLLSSI